LAQGGVFSSLLGDVLAGEVIPRVGLMDGQHGELRPSLSALAARLGVAQVGGPVAASSESRNLDEVMDDFVEEHKLCYEFHDSRNGSSQEDRYEQIFHALQKELCRMTWMPRKKVGFSRARALRVLQCLRLLTRDPTLQLTFFEGGSSLSPPDRGRRNRSSDRQRERDGDCDRDRDRGRERENRDCERGVERERGRERTPLLPPPGPATSSHAAAHLPTPMRQGLPPSPRLSKWRSPEPRVGRHYVRNSSVEQLPSDGGCGDMARGVRLPPLDNLSPRKTPNTRSCGSLVDGAGTTPSTSALLRLLTELVTEYMAEVHGGDVDDMHAADASAGAAMDARLGVAVAGHCVAQIVGMLNRYAGTEARRSRLAQLGALRPLVSLLGDSTDGVVLRCALETLVHFTVHRNAVVLAELAHLTLRDQHQSVAYAQSGHSGDLLPQCFSLLCGHEDMYQVLAAQLLEQLLEEPELRAQLRHLGAIPTLLGNFNIEAPELSSGYGRRSPETCGPVALVTSSQARKTVHLLRCCQKLARDHVELGDTMAVQELREHKALDAILNVLRRYQREKNEVDTLAAALDALAQMCMDDECATALRLQHGYAFAVIGALLVEEPWRPAGASPSSDARPQSFSSIQCSAARLLRFLFAVERNRKAFKHIFSADVFAPFIDVGNYVWPLEAYGPFVSILNGLGEQDVEIIRANFLRLYERGAAQRRERLRDGSEGPTAHPPPPLSQQLAGGMPMSLHESVASGRQIHGYELIECVGAGAFGRVHLARRHDVPGEFALKEVPLTTRSSEPAAQAPQGAAGRQQPPAAAAAGEPPRAPPPSIPQTPPQLVGSEIPRAPPHAPPGGRPRKPGSRCSTPRTMRGSPETPGSTERRISEPVEAASVPQDLVAKDISQEVRLLRQLDHPNIVRYFSSFTTDCGVGNATLWIVMEFCSGVSLQSFTASAREKGLTKLPEEQTWQMFVQLCLALRYLHVDKSIAHRDLTPNNVLVQPHSLAVKIADFGLARQKMSATVGGTAAASMMMSMVGTILYTCPEIVQSKPYTKKTDVWSLGCLLYKMATLSDPFQGSNPLTVARKIVESEYDRLDTSLHSEMLINVCQRCLTVVPESRPDIQEVCQLITPALVHHCDVLQRMLASQPQGRSATAGHGPLGATTR